MAFYSSQMKSGFLIALASALGLAAVSVTVFRVTGDRSLSAAPGTGARVGGEERSSRHGARLTRSNRKVGSPGEGRLTVAEQGDKVRMIRESEDDSTEKVEALWALLPRLDDPATQVEAAGFLASLCEDRQFVAEVGSYLLEPGHPRAVSEAFMINLLDRPVEVGKPVAKVIAGMGDHPLHEYAVRILQQAGDLER